MKVVGIVGSPRKNGNSEVLLAHALRATGEESVDTEMVRLAGLDIRPCNACMSCRNEEACSIDDDLMPIYAKMKEADGILIASPVYFGSTPGLVKALIERTGYICRHYGNPLRGKIGGPLVVARRAGQSFTLAQVTFWSKIMDMVVPGSSYWNMAFGRDRGEVGHDEEGMKTAWHFGKNVAWLVKSLRTPKPVA